MKYRIRLISNDCLLQSIAGNETNVHMAVRIPLHNVLACYMHRGLNNLIT
jgi:hypothetical protein